MVKGIDMWFNTWFLYEFPLLMRFTKFVGDFLRVHFFFIKVAKGFKDKISWVKIMKIMFFIGILMNLTLITISIFMKIRND
jgi:hypothetical protein